MARNTFGFRNINGDAFDIKVLEAPNGWPARSTIKKLRQFIVDEMNKAGEYAKKITKVPGWSPRKTGKLVRSIDWLDATTSSQRRILSGALTVGVPYGRRQEFEHTTKGRYMARAMERAFPKFIQALRNKNVMEDVMFGRRKQIGDENVVGGQRF